MMIKCVGLACRCMLLLLVVSCGQKASDSASEDSDSVEFNKILYDQIMEMHDEMMPKMEDLQKMKSQLKKQMAESADIVPTLRESFDRTINRLDSADKVMMDWMHEFKPLYDTVDAGQAHRYLESQMEKIEQVKKEINEALEEAKKKVED